MEKMITLLNDKDTYSLINKDPIRRITTAVRSMLTRWKTKRYISEAKYKTYIVVTDHFRELMVCRKYINLVAL